MEKKKYKIGFIQGTFDMFHMGHLNVIKRAKDLCEYLIVGVNTDELVEEYKHKRPIVSCEERLAIVMAIRYVDEAVIMKDRDKIEAARKYKFNALIMGSDWKGTDFYNKKQEELKKVNVDIVYLPYTEGTSSTILAEKLGIDNKVK